ncbi:unnamed protein product [Adineta steineri]|uniref:Arrestin C-terminal-like domain-containing protein n=1 Tax=Adineta steineri TaxID=433720 RepID=A0A813Z882_9BILA|nr:unnamed protein product [Adineta steineri]CAF3759323.1 unnamed protein product [Adineta steineri]
MGADASRAASNITIQFNQAQPFRAGQHITGTVAFNNTFVNDVKIQRIFAEFVGEVVYTTKQYTGSGYYNVNHYEPFFQQLQCLQEKQDSFSLEKGYMSWPISFSLADFLPPTLNQLSSHGPYIHYKVRVVFERPEKLKKNVHQDFFVFVVANPSSNLHSTYLPLEATNNNRSDVTLKSALVDRNGPLTPGDIFLLNVELDNPKHTTIKCVSIDLVQHRTIAMGGHCELTIFLSEISQLQEFSGEHFRETLKLAIPADNRIVSSFHYLSPTFSNKPIAVEYMIKLEVKAHGLFKNFIVNIPIVIQSTQMHMEIPNQDEEQLPSYDAAIEKQ